MTRTPCLLSVLLLLSACAGGGGDGDAATDHADQQNQGSPAQTSISTISLSVDLDEVASAEIAEEARDPASCHDCELIVNDPGAAGPTATIERELSFDDAQGHRSSYALTITLNP